MGMYRKEWDCCDSVTETDGWEPEHCPFCAARAAAPVSGPTGPKVDMELPEGDKRELKIMWQEVRDGKLCLCVKIVEAAPVSGQGASGLPPLPAAAWTLPIKRLPAFSSDQMRSYGQLCIDSRPRSEDSRDEPSFIRKPEGPLAAEFTEWADTASGIKGWFEQHNSQYDVRRMLCFLAWEEATRRALASTTPQKA